MRLLLKNISVNCNKDAEADEDKKIQNVIKLKLKTLNSFIKWKERTVGFGLKVHSKKEESGREVLHTKKMRIQVFLFKTQVMFSVVFRSGVLALQSHQINLKVQPYQKTANGKSYKVDKHF
jgi:hypothetical protein